MFKQFILLGAVLLLMLGGCSLTDKVVTPENQFVRVQDDFMQRLRWKDYQGAARHFSEENREAFLQQFRRADDLNVTDVRLVSLEYQAQEQQMQTEIEIEYFLLPSATVKTFRVEQQWHYFHDSQSATGEWRITSLFPEFPGLARP